MSSTISCPASVCAGAMMWGEDLFSEIATLQADPQLHTSTLQILKQAQKPKSGCSITFSSLHPDIPATQHLILWCTLFSIKQQTRFTSSLSLKNSSILFSCLLSSVEWKTHSNYDAGLYIFINFVTLCIYPNRLTCLLPSTFLLLSSLSGRAALHILLSTPGWQVFISGIWSMKHHGLEATWGKQHVKQSVKLCWQLLITSSDLLLCSNTCMHCAMV